MPEEEIEQREDNESRRPENSEQEPVTRQRRRYFTRRNALMTGALAAILIVLISILSVVFYRYGVFDTYVKSQFVAKMAEIGIEFDADVFRLTVNPLELELRNATFTDRVTGEKLFFVRDARIGLTVDNLYAWQLSRDIKVDTTDINGAEIWIRFDENGRSNFSNLTFVEDQAGQRVNFKYDSVKFALKDSVVHFGDLSRKISGQGNNVQLFLEPESYEVPDEEKRYKIDFTSTDSTFDYDGHPLDDIDIRARGIADRTGAEITELKIETPIGVSTMSGTLADWASPRYSLNIESTVDLTQTASIFPLGASLSGVGNFKGTVNGQGEQYRIEGTVDSQALTAEGIYLRALNVTGTVEGTNSNYEANGRAVAELLTFEDFRIDFLRMTGNVIGSGTDFRWIGELQAAAAKTKSLTLGGLFLSDAVAEYKDRELSAGAGNGRAQRFSVADAEFENLNASSLRFTYRDGVTNLSAPGARAATLKTDDYQLSGLTGRNLRVKDDGRGRTDVGLDNVTANSAGLKGNLVRNLRADRFKLTDLPNSTDLDLTRVRADRVDADGAVITGVEAPLIEIRDTHPVTTVYSNNVRIARVDTNAATLGSLNIGGVRLTIRQGTIEGRSNDVDAGTVTLNKTGALPEGGTLQAVQVSKPVFVVEPSGRYRVTADMSVGSGIIGSVPLGAAQASVNVNNDRAALTNLTASVMDGRLEGNATLAFNNRTQSNIIAGFSNLDLSKLLSLQGGRVIPLVGQATGNVNLTFAGSNLRTATGSVNADITASAGNADSGLVPVTGRVELSATNGLFNVDVARLNTPNSELNATGRFDLRSDDSNLNVAVNSRDASEVERLLRVTGISPELEEQLDSLKITVAGNLTFTATVTGNLTDPTLEGRASLDQIALGGRTLGSVTTDIFLSPLGTELRNGLVREADGGTIAFNLSVPDGGVNNTSVQATLTNIDAANLIAALPLEKYLPASIRDFNAQTSGVVNITGLPNNANGEIDLTSSAGSVSGQAFDAFTAKAQFRGTLIDLQNLEIRSTDGYVKASGTYDRASTAFDFDLEGRNFQLAGIRNTFTQNPSVPVITGQADFTAKATGRSDVPSSYNINFSGTGRDVVVNDNAFGQVTFQGTTINQILNADLTATLDGRPQVINATVNFGDENLPFRVATDFNQSPLAPFFALVPQLKGITIAGTGTGRVEFGGNLARRDDQGNVTFTTEGLTGSAQFNQLALQIQDTPLVATEPVVVRFSPSEITFESARFSGGGSNVVIAGTKALTEDGVNNLSIDGRVNLSLLNAFPQIEATDTFFGGFANVAIRLAGVNKTARLSGTATLENASIAAFVGSSRLSFDRVNGQILFSSDQAQMNNIRGFLGGGEFTATGGALFGEGLKVDSFRVALDGNNVTVPLPEDFLTTGDARLEITGRRGRSDVLGVQIAGRILARRSLYTQDIELANIVGARREGSLSSGPSTIRAPRFDLTIEGRDALVVRNNIADLTASVSLRLTGTTENPQISGRITANSGTVFFRRDRYIVQRGVLEFPPDTTIEPVINLQAESEIAGYQIFVNLAGPLTDTEQLIASVRSSPALPQADVISLITTGNLSNTESGIPTLAQSGINTAAEVIADTIINEPARRATDRLFGLNVFEIDPIISGRQLNPGARLTVGRQINNNLRVTYSTNLSQDQNQVLALEYRVSNKLSFVAQYEQRSLSNVTRNRDNFSFEIRFRRRF